MSEAPLFERPQWMSQANCRGLPPDMFLPERGEDTSTAKAVCAECIVRLECLEYALIDPLSKGIWGGTSGRERRRMRMRNGIS